MPDSQAAAPPAPVAPADSPTDIVHFEKWLAVLGERKATDLHLAVGNVPILRIGGELVPLTDEDVLTDERVSRIAQHLLSEAELARLESEREVVVSRTLKKLCVFASTFFTAAPFWPFPSVT